MYWISTPEESVAFYFNRGLVFIAYLDGIKITPSPQRVFFGFLFKSIPLVEGTPSNQQALESGVGALSVEYSPNFIEVVRQKLTREIEDERLAEIKLSLVGKLKVFLIIVDIVG